MKVSEVYTTNPDGSATMEIDFDDDKEHELFLQMAFDRIMQDKPKEQVDYLINYIIVKILEDEVAKMKEEKE
jgi:hypothetical protein